MLSVNLDVAHTQTMIVHIRSLSPLKLRRANNQSNGLAQISRVMRRSIDDRRSLLWIAAIAIHRSGCEGRCRDLRVRNVLRQVVPYLTERGFRLRCNLTAQD